jgi:type II secretory pathway component GspD/PulD (secretin)
MFRQVLITLTLVLLAGCQQPQTKTKTTSAVQPAPVGPTAPLVAPPETPVPRFDESNDHEIAAVLELARQNRWEEARAKAAGILQFDPQNPMLQRLHSWTVQQGHKHREQALEDEIRKVDAKNSVFNPTIPSLLTEHKDRGLPASKDVRDVVDRIENSPYIPETYGKVIRETGPLFDMDAAKGPTAKLLEKEVTVHLDNVPLETVIVNLSQSTGVNIVADKSLPALKAVLNVNLEKVRLGEFFKYIGRNYELQFQVGPDLVWVVAATNKTSLMEETRFYRLKKGFVLPAHLGSEEATRTTTVANNVRTETETQKFKRFVNDEAPAIPAIERAITNLFTGSKVMLDYERNLIVARGTPEQLEVLEDIIEHFDQAIQQVLIEARFVTLSKPAFLRLGTLWETGRATQSLRTPQDFTGLVGSQGLNNLGIGIQETFTNILGSDTLTATISALEQSGESQTLSAPRLTVLNNRPANISDGKVQYYYEQYTVKTIAQQYYTASSFVPEGKPTKITAGAELNVLASIAGDGKHIVLALNPRVNTDVQLVKYATLTDYNSAGQLQSTFDINLPQYRTQELSTRVVVKSGETVAMGGVLERQKSTFVEAVPVLGSIPVIGALFRRRTETDTPRYLLVFVTATILTESGEYLIYDEPASAK